MWSGRFDSPPSDLLKEINASIAFDKRLYAEDIEASRAHAQMLASCGIISAADAAAIDRGLTEVSTAIESGDFTYDPALEDIHMHVEKALEARIGAAAGRLHTARSRNDQVATDLRLYLRRRLDALDALLASYQRSLARRALEEAETLMPGLTHLQPAQPITLGHHLLAYVEMAWRDRGRMRDARARMNYCPLGSAALAGTGFPISRDLTARGLGFAAPCANALDAVASRDFVLEALSSMSIAGIHLSRLAEEMVLWTSPLVGFARFSDQFSTGSSIMPQKRNPDAAELVRAKVGRILGSFQALSLVMKGLPLAYAKDLQEDKEPLFDALDAFSLMARTMGALVEDMTFDASRMEQAAALSYTTATDLADWLVRELQMPFRRAHHVTGELVALAEGQGLALEALPLEQMKSVCAQITASVFSVLGPKASVASRSSEGGTAPEQVRARATDWLRRLSEDRAPSA